MRSWYATSGMMGFVVFAVGCATCQNGSCCKEAAPCRKGLLGQGLIVPYKEACQTREPSHNCLGRIAAWATYRPLCSEAPCDCSSPPTCHPPLFTYFTPSKYNRCYEPVACGGGACGQPWWKFWGKKSCGPCKENSCCDDGWTIKIRLPSISFSRNCNDCGSCKEDKCAGRCLTLPRPISERACENSQVACAGGACNDNGCRKGWNFLGWRPGFLGGCGACGRSGLFADGVGKKCCGNPGKLPTEVDLNHMPILPPDAVKSCKVGGINAMTAREPELAPKPVVEETPAPKDLPK